MFTEVREKNFDFVVSFYMRRRAFVLYKTTSYSALRSSIPHHLPLLYIMAVSVRMGSLHIVEMNRSLKGLMFRE
jgi:hypothetical protein